MPVMELSRMMTVELLMLYAMSARLVIPEWMKVESPMTATVLPSDSSCPTLLKPCSMLTDAPMHRLLSMAKSGAAPPSV